jgi:ligand-binding sensor domain-containing protein
VTVAESPKVPGILWVGTDDGNVQVSKDGGATWTNVSKNVPGIGDTYHIARVEPSHYDAATCYLAVDGHRLDDMKPYLFVTRDYGATWTSIVNNLPKWGNVNVVHEDPRNKDLLYVGTEFGLYISQNGGAEWKPFMSGVPRMRIDDILVHPRDNDLIVGTHGRGIYILDDITALQQMSQKVLDSETHLFEVRPGTLWLNERRLDRYWGGSKYFRGANPAPGTAISYYLKAAPSGDVKMTIADYTGKVVRNITGTKDVGLNRVQWNLRGDPPPRPPGGGGGGGGFGNIFIQGLPLEAGTYVLKLTVNGKDYTTKVVVENDPGIN